MEQYLPSRLLRAKVTLPRSRRGKPNPDEKTPSVGPGLSLLTDGERTESGLKPSGGLLQIKRTAKVWNLH